MQPVYLGLQVGLLIGLFIGPVFIALFESVLEKGYRAGYSAAAGIWLIDLIYGCLFYFSFYFWDIRVAGEDMVVLLALPGSLILATLGIFTVLKSSPKIITKLPVKSDAAMPLWKYGLKGMVINGISPTTAVFWIGVTGSMIAFNFKITQFVLFFVSYLAAAFLMDTLKIVLASKIGSKLTSFHVVKFQQISGVILVLFGLVIFIRFVVM
jgi:threonine/homoserine/homoserine lactone efflux protein